MATDRRTPTVLIAGWEVDTRSVADKLLTEGTVIVHHDLRQLDQGVVLRSLRTVEGERREILEIAHGCVSCTLRHDVLPLLRRLSRRSNVSRIVIALDPALEPEPLCWAIEHVVVADVVGQIDGPAARDVRIEAVVSCLVASSWMEDASGDEILADRKLSAGADDDRTIAQVAVGQVEFADALVVCGDATPFVGTRLTETLDRLAPGAPVVRVAEPQLADIEHLLAQIGPMSRRGEVFDAHAPLLRGEPKLGWDFGVGLLEFVANRPFHPERLHDAIDVLLSGVISTRGRVWVATQPDRVLWLQSAGGGLRIGDAGKWLAAMTPAEREQCPPARRAMAALRWDPRFGDRDISIVALVHDANPTEIDRVLQWALVTDDELQTEHKWATWADPFGSWHADPCEDSESPHAHINREEQA